MKRSRERKLIAGGFGLTLILMASVSILSGKNALQLTESASQIKQTNTVLKTLADISTSVTDAELGTRSYIFLGDPDGFERYKIAAANLKQKIAEIYQKQAFTAIEPQSRDRLNSLIDRQLILFQKSIQNYRATRRLLTPDHPFFVQAEQYRDEIRRSIEALETSEEQLLHVQLDRSQANLILRMWIEILGTMVTSIFLFGVYALLYHQMRKRQRAEASKRVLAQAKEMSELKLQFFSMVSHEFRTPLSLLVGSAQLLHDNLKSRLEPGQLKNLHRIQSSAKAMSQMLTDVLTLSRADAGKLEYNPSLLELQTFCLNLVEDCQMFADTKRKIHFTYQGNYTYAQLDETLIYSILSNLLSNAIKYSPPESTVCLSLICEPGAVVFQVKNEGIGIPPEEIANLYDPFKRGSNTKGILGTGLGLAVVKKCVDRHGGLITVDSEVGARTVFTVRIPRTER